MNITLAQLINVANSCTVNSEPHCWYAEVMEQGQVHFENLNTTEMFWLPLNQEAKKFFDDGYAFQLPDSNETVWIEFFTHELITPELLEKL